MCRGKETACTSLLATVSPSRSSTAASSVGWRPPASCVSIVGSSGSSLPTKSGGTRFGQRPGSSVERGGEGRTKLIAWNATTGGTVMPLSALCPECGGRSIYAGSDDRGTVYTCEAPDGRC